MSLVYMSAWPLQDLAAGPTAQPPRKFQHPHRPPIKPFSLPHSYREETLRVIGSDELVFAGECDG